jgi:uncharacterized membrane protein YdcZ (DUF606 family)
MSYSNIKALVSSQADRNSVNFFDANKTTVSTVTSIGTGASVSVTASQVINGVLIPGGNLGANQTITLPTAADLVSNIVNPTVGSSFLFSVNNRQSGDYSKTIAGGTGVTINSTANAVLAQNDVRVFLCRLTNVTSGTEAAVVYQHSA